MLIGTKKEFREDGTVFYEHSDGRLYPNYLTWCGENGRESVALQRFSASVIDAAQTQGAHVYKKKVSDGMKIFGLRIRGEGERSWLEDLEGDEMQAGMQTKMQDNSPEMHNMQTVQDFSSTSSYERESVPFGSPGKQVEVEV